MFGVNVVEVAFDAIKKTDLDKNGVADIVQLEPVALKAGAAFDDLHAAVDEKKVGAGYVKLSTALVILEAKTAKALADGVQVEDLKLFQDPECQLQMMQVLSGACEIKSGIDQAKFGEAWAKGAEASQTLAAYVKDIQAARAKKK